MAKTGALYFPLPAVADAERVCFKVSVPNDPTHISNFIGAIQLLSRWNSYITDSDHPSVAVAATWRDILLNLYPNTCDVDCPMPIEEYEDEMSLCENLRFQNGVLQAYCCGVWTTIQGQPAQGVGGPSQPGAGAPVPAAGHCVTYQVKMNANEQWLCPAVVNAGDTIVVDTIQGAWTDGAANWYTPDGWIYFAGIKASSAGVNGADPLPASPHMGLITKISGAYQYAGGGATLTVPGGVVNKLLLFQANDASLTDDSGQITFNVTVCNNQAATFTHTFDFRVSDGLWVPVADGAWTPPVDGIWSAGVGWKPNSGPNGGQTLQTLRLNRAFAARTLTSATLTYNLTKGTVLAGIFNDFKLKPGVTNIVDAFVASDADTNGTGKQLVIPTGSYAGIDNIDILINSAYFNPGGALGDCTGVSVVVNGLGTDPF